MTAPEEAKARNRARIAIMDGLDSASLDELSLISKAVARIAVLRETGAKEAPLWWYPMCELNGALRIELADLRREREHAGAYAHEAPDVDGATPTYEGRPLSEALTDAERRLRATTILDVMRGLQDRASLAEIIVTARCLQRIEVIRREPPRERGDGPCGLDDALRLELTDVRLEREHVAAQDEDAACDIERDRAGLTGRSANTVVPIERASCVGADHGGRYCTAELHHPWCPVGLASEAQKRAARDQAVP